MPIQSTSTTTKIVKPPSQYTVDCPRRIPTNGLDALGSAVHISNHRYFRLPPSSLSSSDTDNFSAKIDAIIKNLHSSLGVALASYPPVAGTVRYNEAMQWVLECDGEGASFIVERRERAFEEEVERETVVSPRPQVVLDTPSPVLAVKVTQFSCGTIAVATSMHHVATDLAGFVDFLETWSELSEAMGMAPAFDEFISSRPLTPRHRIDWTHAPQKYFGPPSQSHPPSPPGYALLDAPPTAAPHMLQAHGSIWSLLDEDLKRLKSDLSLEVTSLVASDNDETQPWISSGDALSALLWSALTRAREVGGVPRDGYGVGRSSTASGVETLAMAVDGRERSVGRALAEGGTKYFGNLNLLVQATADRGDLLLSSQTHAGNFDFAEAKTPTARVALAIRAALKDQLSPQTLADRVQFFTQPDNLLPPGRIIWSADCIMTNWSGVDLEAESMGFSGLGKPFETTAGGGPCPGGFFRLMKRPGSTHVLLWVEKVAQEALRADGMLNEYVSFVKDEV